MLSIKDTYFIFIICYIPFIPLSSKSSAEEMSFFHPSGRKSFLPEETQPCILYTHTTMRYRCEILNHGIHGYEVWLLGRNQGSSGVKSI